MDRTKAIDERIHEINRSIQDIQDNIEHKRKEEGKLRAIIEDTLTLKRRFDETNEEVAFYCQGTDFGRNAAGMQAEREAIYREMTGDAESRLEEIKAELKKLAGEEINCEHELQNLRRTY